MFSRAPLRFITNHIRVDLAGETAAVRICKAHLWFYPHDAVVKGILEEEQRHLAVMQQWTTRVRARPTLLDPIFRIASYTMAGATALLGPEAVMCCHAAVEEVIAGHYNEQLLELHAEWEERGRSGTDRTDVEALREVVRKFRDDEQHHHEMGLAYGADRAPFYRALYGSIQVACHIGIWLAKRI